MIKDDNSDGLQNKLINTSTFNILLNSFSNPYHTFVVRKTERLASALYVVTGFIPIDEPIRNRLRVCALELITLSASPAELSEGGVQRFEARCAEIATILQTAIYAGLISPMNAKLIGEEYVSLAGFVQTHASKLREPGHELQKSSISDPKTLSSPIRHKDKSLLRNPKSSKGSNDIKNISSLKDRKSIILSVFNTKPSISLKDISSIVPSVSGKTLQRDLLSLVSQGILLKEGSRRWTIYRKA